MATAKIDTNSNPEKKIEQLLKEVARLKTPDLDTFKAKFDKLFTQKKPPSYSKKEKELINKIKNGGPSQDFLKKFDQLAYKLEQETMTPQENKTFLELVEVTEKWSYQRLLLVKELAKLWDMQVLDVFKRLKITPRKSVYA